MSAYDQENYYQDTVDCHAYRFYRRGKRAVDLD